MIQLKEEQLQTLDTEKQPVAAVDPRTGQVYRLIKQEVYDVACSILKPYNRGCDKGDDDLIRKDAVST
jgi:hypothetical protein